MSWFIKQLLSNSEKIRSQILSISSSVDFEGEPYLTEDIDVYDDLLPVEIEVEKLHKKNLLSELDKMALAVLVTGTPIGVACEDYNVSRLTLVKAIDQFCDKIANILGGKYTNIGYRDYIAEKYGLTDDEILAIGTFLSGNYTYKNKYKKEKHIDITN